MNVFKKGPSAPQSGSSMSSMNGFATVLASIATVFVVPPIWGAFELRIWAELLALYDEIIAIPAYWGIMLATYPLVFYAIRMSLMTTLIAGAIGVALRFV